MGRILGPLSVLSTWLFRPIRRLFGPLHRRRPVLDHDQNDDLPPLPPPWTDPRWFRGGFPPRADAVLIPLVDGEAYFADLHEALLSARRRVTICGWCLTPLLPLRREHRRGEALLAEVLRDVCDEAEVYVLLWAGSPALFEPTTAMVEAVQKRLQRISPRVLCRLDHAPFSHDHHQKAVTIDGCVAYLGGMDLTTFQGDRWDSSHHRLRFGTNWHDVQMRLEGEIVRDVEENFCQRWNAVTGDRLEPLERIDEGGGTRGHGGSVLRPVPPYANTRKVQSGLKTQDSELKTQNAQLIRTIPAGFYGFAPEGEFGIHHALTTAIRRAQRLIYLENQYLWSPEIVAVLEEVMDRRHCGALRILVVLPAKAEDGKYDNDDHVDRLTEKDAGRGIFSVYSLYTGGPATGHTGYRYLPIYVHAKVSIVDDEWLSVGSANLNGRGLATDTEIGVQCIDPQLARSLRVRLWSEHLGMTEEAVAAAAPIELVDKEWPLAAREMERQLRAGGAPPAGTARRYVAGHNLGSRVLDVVQNATLEH